MKKDCSLSLEDFHGLLWFRRMELWIGQWDNRFDLVKEPATSLTFGHFTAASTTFTIQSPIWHTNDQFSQRGS